MIKISDLPANVAVMANDFLDHAAKMRRKNLHMILPNDEGHDFVISAYCDSGKNTYAIRHCVIDAQAH